ncbi:MAG: IS66 family insertion sequence element accessory protein TnpA [Planctomyces sp.]|jgi:transposase-like protein
MMRRRYSAEQWAEWISEQQESEQSIAEFCSWRGVSANTFYLWRRKLEAAVEIDGRSGSEKSVRVTRPVAAGFSHSSTAAA